MCNRLSIRMFGVLEPFVHRLYSATSILYHILRYSEPNTTGPRKPATLKLSFTLPSATSILYHILRYSEPNTTWSSPTCNLKTVLHLGHKSTFFYPAKASARPVLARPSGSPPIHRGGGTTQTFKVCVIEDLC